MHRKIRIQTFRQQRQPRKPILKHRAQSHTVVELGDVGVGDDGEDGEDQNAGEDVPDVEFAEDLEGVVEEDAVAEVEADGEEGGDGRAVL